jgi:hypothetical protein
MAPARPEADAVAELNHPDLHGRLRALHELKHLGATDQITIEAPRPWVNMLCRTWHSYNARGFSPCRLAWELFRHGVSVGGMVDAEVLDGLDEGLAASDALLYKFTVGLQTRVHVKEFAGEVLNAPHEPGVAWFCGIGFVTPPLPKSPGARTLARLRSGAERRTGATLDRLNAYLDEVRLDLDEDVIPRCPGENATERRLPAALQARAEKVFPEAQRRVRFWAAKLLTSRQEAARLLTDDALFRDTLYAKLITAGAPGWTPPDPKQYPPLAEAVAMIRGCGALPAMLWRDGTHGGESDAELLVDYCINAGCVAACLLPERNWNLKDPVEKSRKVARMEEFLAVCKRRHLPLLVGTAMETMSQPLVDHFDAPELRPHRDDFLAGARIAWGHSLLLRHGGFGYISPQAEAAFGKDVRRKNTFYLEVGRRPVPHGGDLSAIRRASRSADAKAVLRALPT